MVASWGAVLIDSLTGLKSKSKFKIRKVMIPFLATLNYTMELQIWKNRDLVCNRFVTKI